MMAAFDTSYQQFTNGEDSEETPQGSGVMIHVVPECGKASRWNHIEDLDSFFVRIYQYHQKHGFACMMLQEFLELVQFIFVVIFSLFLFNCINYPVLFGDKKNNSTDSKITISDVVYDYDVCTSHMGGLSWTVVTVASFFWFIRFLRVLYHTFQYWDVKAFFNTALKINDNDLDNVTWHEVQKKIRQVQLEQQMCIHKRDLTELDIYHRILRYKNYLVAMVNKSLLPVRFQVPFFGELAYLSHGLKYNFEFLLFWGPLSPFENSWHLKADFKKMNKRQELAHSLSRYVLIVALINLALSPLILLWQILYSFFNYAEVLKREPGSLGSRCWSLYGRCYLRHFNELDHELHARLNRAYRPAAKYMNIFTSPLLTVLAKNVVFIAGAVLAVLVVLSVYDEDVLTVEHILTAITVLGTIVATFRALIPDENLVRYPEHLMSTVLAHVHYLPTEWRGHAHTVTVRKQFSHLFQYKFSYLVMELVSPLVTPAILFFCLRKRCLEIVDFYRSFTVEVAGVGDVCAFAQMDIRAHGDPTWSPDAITQHTNQYHKAEEGKTELSLVHFTLTNPGWSPPKEAEPFLSGVRSNALNYLVNQTEDQSLSMIAANLGTMLPRLGESSSIDDGAGLTGGQPVYQMHTSHTEGPRLHHLHPPPVAPSLGASVFGVQQQSLFLPGEAQEQTAIDMSLTALYLHHLHHKTVVGRSGYHQIRGGVRSSERSPLLHPLGGRASSSHFS